MSTQQQALAGSADAQQDILSRQVNLFLFDLKNEATEHGFKPDESWMLQLATDAEITDLKKLHHPVLSLRLQPEALLQAFQQVKNKMQQSLSKTDMSVTIGDIIDNEKKLLAAYPIRSIRQ